MASKSSSSHTSRFKNSHSNSGAHVPVEREDLHREAGPLRLCIRILYLLLPLLLFRLPISIIALVPLLGLSLPLPTTCQTPQIRYVSQRMRVCSCCIEDMYITPSECPI